MYRALYYVLEKGMPCCLTGTREARERVAVVRHEADRLVGMP